LPTDQRDYSTESYPAPSAPLPPIMDPARGLHWLNVVTVIIAVNVAVFVIQTLLPKGPPPSSVFPFVAARDNFGRIAVPAPQDDIYWYGTLQTVAVVVGRQYWRLITAQYLHASAIHIGLNMLALWFLGRPLAQMWSARKFFAVYTVCGLAGNIFFAILGAKGVIDPRQPAVGASGCIYGLLGIVAVLFPTAQIYMYFIPIPVKIRTAAVVMGAIAFMTVIERKANYGGEACHLAGLAFGVWWAMHGDEWWSNSEWALPGMGKKGKS
jgi:membrane associated rhomboid family serine protease